MSKPNNNEKSLILKPTRRNFVRTTSVAGALGAFGITGLAKAADPEFVIKLGTNAPADTPWHKHLKRWRKRIKEETGGRVKVKAYWGGALGDEKTVAGRVAKGGIQAYGGTAGGMANRVPEIMCLELPYLWPSLSKADTVLDGLYDHIDGLLNKRGYKLLFFSENGHRSIGLKGSFAKSPSDLKGKKVRAQPTDVHLDTWRAMGASPVPMAVTEVLSSLQTGVIEGFDNTPLFTFAASWWQAIDHFTLTRHSYQPGFIVLNKDYWDSMPKDLQKIVLGDPMAESKKGRKGVRAMTPLLIKNFESAGVKVHKSTSAEKAAFAKATKSAHAKFMKKYKGEGAKLLKKIQAGL